MKKLRHFYFLLTILIVLGTGTVFANTEDGLIEDFEYYEAKIIERLSKTESKEELERRKDAVLQRAKKIYDSRSSLSIVGSPGGRKAKNGTLSGNLVRGIMYFNYSDGKPSPYGELIWVNFGNTSADFKVDGFISGFGTTGVGYRLLNGKVLVASRFGDPLLTVPYPFKKGCFKATVEKGLSSCVGREVLVMNVPIPNMTVNLTRQQVKEKLKGKTFIGLTENPDIKITINDRRFSPDIFTVVEFSDDGCVSISLPQLDRVDLFEAETSLTKDGTLIWIKDRASYNMDKFRNDYPNLPFNYYDRAAEVFGRHDRNSNSMMLGTIMNNGDALNLMNPFEGPVNMIKQPLAK